MGAGRFPSKRPWNAPLDRAQAGSFEKREGWGQPAVSVFIHRLQRSAPGSRRRFLVTSAVLVRSNSTSLLRHDASTLHCAAGYSSAFRLYIPP